MIWADKLALAICGTLMFIIVLISANAHANIEEYCSTIFVFTAWYFMPFWFLLRILDWLSGGSSRRKKKKQQILYVPTAVDQVMRDAGIY